MSVTPSAYLHQHHPRLSQALLSRTQTFNLSETAPINTILGKVGYWDPENDTAVFSMVRFFASVPQ